MFQHSYPKSCWLWTVKIISVSTPKFWSGRRYQWWWNWILFYQKVGWTITNWTISIFSTSIIWEVAEAMITMHATTNAVTSSSWTYFMRFFIKRKKIKTSITDNKHWLWFIAFFIRLNWSKNSGYQNNDSFRIDNMW